MIDWIFTIKWFYQNKHEGRIYFGFLSHSSRIGHLHSVYDLVLHRHCLYWIVEFSEFQPYHLIITWNSPIRKIWILVSDYLNRNQTIIHFIDFEYFISKSEKWLCITTTYMTNSNTLNLALKWILNELLSKCTKFYGSFLICDAKNSIEGCKLSPIQYTVTKTVFKMHISINHCFFSAHSIRTFLHNSFENSINEPNSKCKWWIQFAPIYSGIYK